MTQVEQQMKNCYAGHHHTFWLPNLYLNIFYVLHIFPVLKDS